MKVMSFSKGTNNKIAKTQWWSLKIFFLRTCFSKYEAFNSHNGDYENQY